MGVDYYAYAVIGCEVTGKLHDETHEKRCACPPPPVGAKYCPTCGLSTRPTLVRRAKPWYDEDNHQIGLLTVSFTTDGKRAIAGIRSKVSSSGTFSENNGFANLCPMAKPNEFLDTVKSELEKVGLWDPISFGLWAVLHCSF